MFYPKNKSRTLFPESTAQKAKKKARSSFESMVRLDSSRCRRCCCCFAHSKMAALVSSPCGHRLRLVSTPSRKLDSKTNTLWPWITGMLQMERLSVLTGSSYVFSDFLANFMYFSTSSLLCRVQKSRRKSVWIIQTDLNSSQVVVSFLKGALKSLQVR